MELTSFESMPSVGSVMTPFPFFVEVDDSVEQIEEIFRDHPIRHVPVKDDDAIVGIVSERDLFRRVPEDLPRSERRRIRVRDLMSVEPYVVEFDTSLEEVLRTMVDRTIGTAIVSRGARLAGILTTTDVCRLLGDVLRDRFEAGDAA